jgi:hypothetical protein
MQPNFMNVKNETRAILLKGGGAATAAMLATMLCDKRENGEWWRALNAVSHMIRGDEAKRQNGFSVRYTLPSLALHVTSICGWAFCHRAATLGVKRVKPAASTRERKMRALSLGVAVSMMAYIIDFHVVPPRLRPGIEAQISRRALFFVYLVLAVSLAVSGEKEPA